MFLIPDFMQDLENICGTDRIIKLISPTVLKVNKVLSKTMNSCNVRTPSNRHRSDQRELVGWAL